MHQHYIVSGTFLILSIIDFALVAPVLVQEKHQASVDVVHVPEDLVTVLWEQGEDKEFVEVMKLVEWLHKENKAWNEHLEFYPKSSVTHALSSTAPPGPDHGSTNILQPPTLNPALSTANPYPELELSRPWSPVQGL
jgi:hypothetical protein